MIAVLAANTTVISDAITATVRRDQALAGDGLGGPATNPNTYGAAGSTTGWTQYGNSAITAPATTDFGPTYDHCLQVVNTGSGNRAARIQLVNVQPDLPYSGTWGVELTSGGSGTAYLDLYDPTVTTLLKRLTFTVTGDVSWPAYAFSVADIAGYTNPYLVVEFPDTTAQTFRFIAPAMTPTPNSSIYVGPAETNLVPNGSAVTNTNGCISYSNATISRSTTVGKFNGTSFKVLATAGASALAEWLGTDNSTKLAVTAGTAYVASLWAQKGTGSRSAQASIYWFDSSDRLVGQTDGTSAALGVPQIYTAAGTAPLGATKALVIATLLSAAANDYMNVSGVQLAIRAVGTAVTLSGNEITDATRAVGTAGDGQTVPDKTTGIWAAATNKVIQSFPGASATTNVTLAGDAAATLTKATDATAPFQGSSTTVWLLDNSAGVANATVEFSGTASAAAHAASIWYKTTTGTPTLSIAAAGAVSLTGTSSYTRASMTVTASSGDKLRITAPAGAVVRFTGAQLETGPIATPVIATNGTSASRSPGRVQMASSVFSATQGWVAYCFKVPVATASYSTIYGSGTFARVMAWDDGTNTNSFRLVWRNDTNQWRFIRSSAGGNSSIDISQTFAANDTVVLLVAWTSTQTLFSVNGAVFVTSGNTFVPTGLQSTFNVGSDSSGALQGDLAFRWVITGTGTLANADATTINGWGNTPPTWAQLQALNAGAASPTALYTGSTGVYTTADPAAAQPFTGDGATRAVGLLQPPSRLIGPSQYWVILRAALANDLASATKQPLLEWATTTDDRIVLYTQAGVIKHFRTGAATGAGQDLLSATLAAGTSATFGFAGDATAVHTNLNMAAWSAGTAASVPLVSALPALLSLGSATVSGQPATGIRFPWAVFGTGDYTKIDRSKLYWTSDADPDLATINADSPGAGATCVFPMSTLAGEDIPLTASGILSLVPLATGTVTATQLGV